MLGRSYRSAALSWSSSLLSNQPSSAITTSGTKNAILPITYLLPAIKKTATSQSLQLEILKLWNMYFLRFLSFSAGLRVRKIIQSEDEKDKTTTIEGVHIPSKQTRVLQVRTLNFFLNKSKSRPISARKISNLSQHLHSRMKKKKLAANN